MSRPVYWPRTLGARWRHARASALPSPLLWAPPGYPDYTGYKHIYLDNGSSKPTRDSTGSLLNTSTDYIVHFPAYPITDDGGVMIGNNTYGVRNIVIVGGEIYNSYTHTVPFSLSLQIGLYLPNIVGIAHIEGMYIHGVGVGDCIELGSNPNTYLADIRVQNCRLVNQHITQSTGSHPDTFQCYDGPAYWRLYQNTCISNGTIRTWQPQEYGTHQIQGVDIRRQNWVVQQSTVEYGTYALWDDTTQAWWPEYHEDIWFWTDPSHSQAPIHSIWRNGNAALGMTPGNYGVTGEAINWGLRPQGDWVPASMVTAGNYLSPGYQ